MLSGVGAGRADGQQNTELPDLPNPYRTVSDVVSVPEGRVMGSSNAVDIRKKDQAIRRESGSAGNSHLIGIDVVDAARAVAGHTSNNRKILAGGEQVEQRTV